MHPLQQQVRQVGQLAQRVRWAYGLGWVFAIAAAALVLIGAADFLLRSDDAGVRTIFSLAVLFVIGAAAWRFLWPAVTSRYDDVQVAQRIEQRWPHLDDRLSSSLEFLAQGETDHTAGSPELRRIVVAEATAQLDGMPLSEVVDRRRVIPALAVAGGLALLIGLLWIVIPKTCATAAGRLLAPWSDQQWERYNDLKFTHAPPRVPLGEPYRVELTDGHGRLPEVVNIYYRFDGQDLADVQPQPMKPTGEAMVHSLSRVTQPFEMRAVGGDDATEWMRVEVVEPPRIDDLTITLHPPTYTSLPAAPSPVHIEAIAGTSVSLAGRATSALSSAKIVVDSGDQPHEYPLRIGEDGQGFQLELEREQPWRLVESGAYRLILEGKDGVKGGENDRHQIDVRPDMPPRVSIESPEANVFVTADASVPLKAVVRDDLAIQQIELRYSRSDESETGEKTITLYEGPTQAPAPMSEASELLEETREVAFTWKLRELGELPAGAAIIFSIAASDYQPQEDQSPPRRITIITRDQLEDRIAQRQSFLLAQIAETIGVQREVRSQTGGLQVQFETTGQVAQGDVVDMQSAELNQRRVQRLLTGEQDGVLAQIDALLEIVARNRLDNPDLVRRMQRLHEGVIAIDKELLPEIQRNLLTGLKAGQNALRDAGEEAVSGPPAREVSAMVDKAAGAQDETIERLAQLLGNLSQWDSYRRFSRQVSGLRRDQQALAEQTAQLRASTLSKTAEQLTSQERADLGKLARRQTELARRLESLLAGMQQMQGELGAKDPLAAQTLQDAVELARSKGLAGKMHQTSRQIEENRLGQATGEQEALGQGLDELLDTLTGRRVHELSRKVEQLKAAAAELEGLKEQAKGLREKTAAAQQNPNESEKKRELQRLKKEREAQQQQMKRLARKLERLQAENAAQALSRAADHTQQAGEAADQGDTQGQAEQADLAAEQLAEAEKQLARQIKQAERDLLDEQLARLEQALDGLIQQQQNINNETLRLDALLQQSGSLTRGQLASVRTLALQQQGLMEETSDFAEKTKAAEVFFLALENTVREMALAAEKLDAAETGDATQRAERNALRRLEQLVEAMQDDNDQPPEEAGGGAGGGNQGTPPDGIKNIAQIKLLKLMQQSLRERTKELETLRQRQGEWTDEQLEEIAVLAQEQGRLAELLLALTQPAEEDVDDADAQPGTDEDAELDKLLDGELEGEFVP